MKKERFSFYKEHPKTCSPDDFWGQVKRTVNGMPVSQDQIDMIVNAVVAGLELNQDDILLDLCCGNGALSALLFRHCRGGLGVDFSEYLISVANANFSAPPHETYMLQDVVEYCGNPVTPERFTKMVCYGSFPFIEYERAEAMLRLLGENFPSLARAFIGNCPDRELMAEFFGDRQLEPGTENDPDSPIGIWRSQEEFIALANRCGWHAVIHKMPPQYYAAHYRYDVILSR
jgi:SAM-dependent methyltransferase